jgi:hypothetical protein
VEIARDGLQVRASLAYEEDAAFELRRAPDLLPQEKAGR